MKIETSEFDKSKDNTDCLGCSGEIMHTELVFRCSLHNPNGSPTKNTFIVHNHADCLYMALEFFRSQHPIE